MPGTKCEVQAHFQIFEKKSRENANSAKKAGSGMLLVAPQEVVAPEFRVHVVRDRNQQLADSRKAKLATS